jgi:hypothetical protein
MIGMVCQFPDSSRIHRVAGFSVLLRFVDLAEHVPVKYRKAKRPRIIDGERVPDKEILAVFHRSGKNVLSIIIWMPVIFLSSSGFSSGNFVRRIMRINI